MSDETVKFKNVTVKRNTEKALLCHWDGVDHWVPCSQITDESEIFMNDEGTVVINGTTLETSLWWAEKAKLA